MYKEKICNVCNKPFIPISSNQKRCKREFTTNCKSCGTLIKLTCMTSIGGGTCSTKCANDYRKRRQSEGASELIRQCAECGEDFRPTHGSQVYCTKQHTRVCVICSTVFNVSIHNNPLDRPSTCSKACKLEYKASKYERKTGYRNPFSDPKSRAKASVTYQENHGYNHPMHNPEVKKKVFATYFKNTGYTHPQYNPESRRKSGKSRKSSSLEARLEAFLNNYNIEYIREHVMSKDGYSHAFDFLLPKYKIIIDTDGEYYHAYCEDPNGKQVLEYYDETRLHVVPNDHILHIIIGSHFESGIKELYNLIRSIDFEAFNYDSYMFDWCRSNGFPYPEYSDKRIQGDYAALCKWSGDKYSPACLLSISAIRHFHRSMYHCHLKGYKSPFDGWNDDHILKKVIANRLIYKNDVDPSKLLPGFSIPKRAPKVSTFNPVLARYITMIYLSEFDEVFDPFSGFSGRLLGVASTGKRYIGQDLDERFISESHEIANCLGIDNYDMSIKDILLDERKSYECLLTCPPYYNKEIYGRETEFKSCDDWISYILEKYTCNKYVFVVDDTTKYADNIVETIESSSHLYKYTEQIIVI